MGSEIKFYDKDGQECSKEQAVKGEILEYDHEGKLLQSTLFRLDKPQKEQ